MIAVTQIVKNASVEVVSQPETKRSISGGLVVYLCVSPTDTEIQVEKLVSKILKLRIFPDSEDKMNQDILTTKGEILLISQFTLLADLKGNNRPSFSQAANKDLALSLYELFADKLTAAGITVQNGYFGEHMSIGLTLLGPVTIILDSDKI